MTLATQSLDPNLLTTGSHLIPTYLVPGVSLGPFLRTRSFGEKSPEVQLDRWLAAGLGQDSACLGNPLLGFNISLQPSPSPQRLGPGRGLGGHV